MKYSDREIEYFLNQKNKIKIDVPDTFPDDIKNRLTKYNITRKSRLRNFSLAVLFLFAGFTGYKFSEYYYSSDIDYQDLTYSYSTSATDDYYLNYGYTE